MTTLLAFGLGLLFVRYAWRTLLLFLFAILFAYLLEPLVSALQERLRLSRGKAVALLYLVGLAGLAMILVWLTPRIVHEVERLSRIGPALIQQLMSGEIVARLGREHGWSMETELRVRLLLIHNQGWIAKGENMLASQLRDFAGYALWLALIPILAIFFLIGGEAIADIMLDELGRGHDQAFFAGLLEDMHEVLAGYIRAQILLTAIAFAAYALGFELLRVPYALALAGMCGMLEFIPVVGPFLAAVSVVATAFLLGYSKLLALLVFLGLWRLLQDYYNSPHLMGRHVRLHPLAVLFGVLAGAELGGVIGVYLSVPALATLRVVWRRWRNYQSTTPADKTGTGPVILPPGAVA